VSLDITVRELLETLENPYGQLFFGESPLLDHDATIEELGIEDGARLALEGVAGFDSVALRLHAEVGSAGKVNRLVMGAHTRFFECETMDAEFTLASGDTVQGQLRHYGKAGGCVSWNLSEGPEKISRVFQGMPAAEAEEARKDGDDGNPRDTLFGVLHSGIWDPAGMHGGCAIGGGYDDFENVCTEIKSTEYDCPAGDDFEDVEELDSLECDWSADGHSLESHIEIEFESGQSIVFEMNCKGGWVVTMPSGDTAEVPNHDTLVTLIRNIGVQLVEASGGDAPQVLRCSEFDTDGRSESHFLPLPLKDVADRLCAVSFAKALKELGRTGGRPTIKNPAFTIPEAFTKEVRLTRLECFQHAHMLDPDDKEVVADMLTGP